mmetsp:Transcript_136606/g.304467  ORF Transcript_136606/g.304467 Transcript_136606/m.304467 type:complete len:100 (-) Transcript_136606:193-492(-)
MAQAFLAQDLLMYRPSSATIFSPISLGPAMRTAVAAILVGLVSGASAYGPEALSDEVHGLPGVAAVSWRMFSGYIDVSAPGEAKPDVLLVCRVSKEACI